MVSQSQQEVRTAAEKGRGQGCNRGQQWVVVAAQAEHRHCHLICITQGLIPIPVHFPVLPAFAATSLSGTEHELFHVAQRGGAQHLVHVHHCTENERMPHRLMEMKMINLQRAEFKDTPKIKVKK
uniref:Uncharacterized protein n=1 Tax=Paramormyrops kingsleyae TaxID=1676925 RepID=A0A3B3R3L8_9TELE